VSELTLLLQKVQAGDAGALDALFAVAYPELQRLAKARLRDSGHHTLLDTRSLVHESYLRYLNTGQLRAEDRRAFFAYASQVMRSVIVNAARDRAAGKRGAGQKALSLSTEMGGQVAEGERDVLRLNDALEVLERADPRLAQLVQMRYFGGYSEQEIAETLEVTERTVNRLWTKAKLMLQAAME
jgi:RNA polymerase sigma factor (TIGR02999 family)